jgi:hypothetical protein
MEDDERSRTEFERQLVLQEYKTHHEEVHKWHSYMNQAVGAYLVIFSILATLISQYKISEKAQVLVDVPTLKQWIPIVVIYASFALLYVLYQFRFMTVLHTEYVLGPLRERMRNCGAGAAAQWDASVTFAQKRMTWQTRWPLKHGINLVPYAAVVAGIGLYFCGFFGGGIRAVCNGSQLTCLFYFFVEAVMPVSLLIWCRECFRYLSDRQKTAALAE